MALNNLISPRSPSAANNPFTNSPITPNIPSTVELTSDLLNEFSTGRLFHDNTNRINSIDFRSAGDYLVTASDDESIHLYAVESGTLKKTIFSKRYGCDNIRFTHHPAAIICSSNNDWDYSLRYLSLHDNRYLRYYKGHRAKVLNLAMSPIDDSFLSAALDQSVRLWDLRTNIAQGLIRINGRPAVSFDPQGLIFAVAAGDNTVKLYDKRSYDKGPFATFIVPFDGSASTSSTSYQWSGLKFSPDGKYMLLSSLQGKLILLDAFSGFVEPPSDFIIQLPFYIATNYEMIYFCFGLSRYTSTIL
jgi:COMPASS component SWD2